MAAGKAWSVGQINTYLKRMFEGDYLLRSIFVRGEVSNLKYHSSGHIYFSLKDASGTLPCVMFAGNVQRGLSFHMKDGDAVVVQGRIDVYEQRSQYQLYAANIIHDGVGYLNERYELLKKKLEEMGMFDESYKQPIPKYIKRLGVVTSPTGAAVRDIINIARRRNPYVEIILYPAIVQGEEATASVVRGIYLLDHLGDEDPEKKVDTIIVGRGGGSLEDLWAFNEEAVAQAIFDCATPIISAVGHETDTTIADYVADLRAPTPSAAAELAVYDHAALVSNLLGFQDALTQRMYHRLDLAKHRALGYARELGVLSPMNKIARQKDRAAQIEVLLNRDMQRVLVRDRHRLELLAGRMERVSPAARLSGSYGFITGEDNRPVRSVADVKKGSILTVRMHDGQVTTRVEDVTKLDER